MPDIGPGTEFGSLPVFDNHHRGDGPWTGLSVEGLVQNGLVFTAEQLLEMTRQALTEDFRCQEGWTVPGQRWEGVPLAEILDAVGVLPNARFASVSAAGFAVTVPLEDASQTLLATRLNGEDLPDQHGGPCRLVAVDQVCYASVKWVDTIIITEEPPAETAREIAMARNPR